MRIYLDNAATTQLDPSAAAEMRRLGELVLGNASSIHTPGIEAATVVEKARFTLARAIGASPEEIIFTASGTESNNLALKGFCLANRERGNHIIVSAIEHACVSGAIGWLERQGFRVSVLGVDEDGRVSLSELESLIEAGTLLVSIMHANNEIGVIQDLGAIARLCNRRGVAFHSDAVQSFMKVPIDVKETPVTFLTFSAHKIHGPRGVAALFVRKGVVIEPLLHGGGQEQNLRSGTMNVEGLAGFAKAITAFQPTHVEQMRSLKRALIEGLRARLPAAVINGPDEGLCNIVNFSLPGFLSADLIRELQRREIYVSAGSACLSKKSTGSFVVRALGRDEACIQSALRVSFSRQTTSAEIQALLDALETVCAESLKKEAYA